LSQDCVSSGAADDGGDEIGGENVTGVESDLGLESVNAKFGGVEVEGVTYCLVTGRLSFTWRGDDVFSAITQFYKRMLLRRTAISSCGHSKRRKVNPTQGTIILLGCREVIDCRVITSNDVTVDRDGNDVSQERSASFCCSSNLKSVDVAFVILKR